MKTRKRKQYRSLPAYAIDSTEKIDCCGGVIFTNLVQLLQAARPEDLVYLFANFFPHSRQVLCILPRFHPDEEIIRKIIDVKSSPKHLLLNRTGVTCRIDAHGTSSVKDPDTFLP
jgi:hypothetical protein